MADLRPMQGGGPAQGAGLSLPHRVVIDGMGFLCAKILADSWDDLALDVIEQALPQAKPTGLGPLDRLVQAAADLVAARRALARAHTSERETRVMQHGMAQMRAQGAVAEFYRARLAQSATALLGDLPTPAADASSAPAGVAAAQPGPGGG